MLILSRRAGEKIIIDVGGTRIEVMPLTIGRVHVKVGINAPRNVTVHREEIAAQIEQERKP